MFPPESTATARLACTLPESSAARPTAPAPSTTALLRSSSWTIVWLISASVTVTTSPTSSRISWNVISPGGLTAIPSAIVSVCGTAVVGPGAGEPHGRPVALGRAYLGERRCLGHVHRRVDAGGAGCERDRLGVVPGGRGDDAGRPLGRAERLDLGVRPPDLERPGALLV